MFDPIEWLPIDISVRWGILIAHIKGFGMKNLVFEQIQARKCDGCWKNFTQK